MLVEMDGEVKIVFSGSVEFFFLGVFAFFSGVTGPLPWFVTPCIEMLAYGYPFCMGFMNYYLSLGLACFGLAILWRGRGIDWIAGGLIAALAWLAHPIGFLWLLGTLAYVRVRANMPGWWKLAMPLAAASGFAALCLYVARRPALMADWDRGPFYLYNGADQLWLFGTRYVWLAGAALFLRRACARGDLYSRT